MMEGKTGQTQELRAACLKGAFSVSVPVEPGVPKVLQRIAAAIVKRRIPCR